MKTFIQWSETSETGYELFIFDDNGKIITIPIDERFQGEDTLILPENPSNRKYLSPNKVEKAGGWLELKYKEPKKRVPQTENKDSELTFDDFMSGSGNDCIEIFDIDFT